MIKMGKILAGLGLISCTAYPAIAHAQITQDPTPRQVFVSFVTGTPVAEVKFKPLSQPVPIKEASPSPLNVLLPLPPQSPDIEGGSAELSKPMVDDIIEIVPAETVEPEFTAPKRDQKPQQSHSDLQPFYVTAEDYIMARGGNALDQVILDYEVTPINTVLGLSANSKSVRLIIGPDFAAVTREDKTRIFDFKMRRLLTVRSGETRPIFDNISLYPVALKNIETVKSATQNGSRVKIPIGPDKTLDAFWMESSLGWSARENIENLSVSLQGDLFTAQYEDKTAVSMTLDGPVLISESLRASLFAFLHHDVAIHPVILKELGLPLSVPNRLEVMSFSPNYPDGLKTVWVLKNSETVASAFPLPQESQPSIAVEKGSPVEFVIYSHRRDKTDHKRINEDDLRQKVYDMRTAGNNVASWLNAKELENRLGGCQNDPALLCQDIQELETEAAPQSELGRLLWATQDQKSSSMKASAFEVLAAHIQDGNAPAFLVKIAGTKRAHIKSKTLKNETTKGMRADRLLEEALVKNPADPEVYRMLSQVYASQRRYAESWNLQDAMRRMPDVSDALTKPINRVEASLIRQAPAFFIPETP